MDPPDFLGFDLKEFEENLDVTNSPVFPPLTAEQIAELEAYCKSKHYFCHIKRTAEGQSFLSRCSVVHTCGRAALTKLAHQYNKERGESANLPLSTGAFHGRCDVNGIKVNADYSLGVFQLLHAFASLVVEVHHSSTESLAAFHARLKDLINHTSDVMVVIGLKIDDPFATGAFVALAAMYERNSDNRAALVQHMSFGSAPVQTAVVQEWMSAVAPVFTPFEGTGIMGCRPCDDADLPEYQLRLRESHLLTMNGDARDPSFHGAHTPVLGPTGTISLDMFLVQTEINEAYARDSTHKILPALPVERPTSPRPVPPREKPTSAGCGCTIM